MPGAGALSRRAAKRAARALAAQQGASVRPLQMPPPNKIVRMSSQPLHRYAFFTPSSPFICSWTQPNRRDHFFGPGVSRCEDILGYKFKSKVLLAEALNIEVNSSPAGQLKLGTAHFYLAQNKRLAIYGDSIVRTYLARKWLELGPSSTGASWGVLSSKVLSDQNLASIYLKLGLAPCMTSAPNDGNLNPDKLPKYMATTVEAIIAAVFVDGGDEALELAMERFGIDQHFHEEPAVYDFFRHGQTNENLPSPIIPSPRHKAGKAKSSV
ncbi:hypothetical protein PG990_013667 [Apiospora arundinis]